jgi:hypothetical protein
MTVESIHPGKGLLAPITSVRPEIQMQGLMALAVVLACESLFASWPLALERPFFIVRSQVSYTHELSNADLLVGFK